MDKFIKPNFNTNKNIKPILYPAIKQHSYYKITTNAKPIKSKDKLILSINPSLIGFLREKIFKSIKTKITGISAIQAIKNPIYYSRFNKFSLNLIKFGQICY